jgi:hypothetical protein
MDVDIGAMKQALGTLGTALGILKQAKELLPAGPERDEFTETLEQAERKLKLAESQAAQALGYELCRKHFPPEIMLSEDEMIWKCPKCGNEKDTGPLVTIL